MVMKRIQIKARAGCPALAFCGLWMSVTMLNQKFRVLAYEKGARHTMKRETI